MKIPRQIRLVFLTATALSISFQEPVSAAALLVSRETAFVGSTPNENFGSTAHLSADIAVVGGDALSVFERNAGGIDNWGLVKIINGAGEVALSGETLIFGTNVFDRNEGGPSNWGQSGTITERSGNIIGFSGNTLTLGNPLYSCCFLTAIGKVDVLQRHQNGENQWGHVEEIRGPTELGRFGQGGAFHGDTLAALSFTSSLDLVAHIHQRNQGGANNWGQVSVVPVSAAAESVALNSRWVAVAAPSENRVYAGPHWSLTTTLTTNVSGFGTSIALDGDRLIVGAPGGNKVYVFDAAQNWKPVGVLQQAGSRPGDNYGEALAQSGDLVLVGAPRYDGSTGGILNAGAAYLHRLFPGAPSISVTRSNNAVVVYWPRINPSSQVILQESAGLHPVSWNDLPSGGTNPVTIPRAGPSHFFRLRRDVNPSIATHPRSASVFVGGTNVFTLEAEGLTPFTYQWQFDFADIPGATEASLAIQAAEFSDDGRYRVLVTDAFGARVVSQSATLEVLPPNIITQPESRSVQAGGTAFFGVATEGTGPFTYQWQHDGVDIPGATAFRVVIRPAQPSDAGIYRVIVTDATGTSVTSEGATLQVL